MPATGDLCSGSSSCQAPGSSAFPVNAKPLSDVAVEPQSSWNSLQTFSFVRWCSRLLRDVLASRTPFAAFLKTTLHTSRSPSLAPAKALYPLPFPKFGLFTSRSSRQSSRARRKLAFDQAFHILVAALNFLHADCGFPLVELMTRVPSSAQQTALWNLRCLLKAFGNSGENFEVPKSGRRSTNLVSGLCDLSEFLTRSGASSNAYFHGFSGDPAFSEGSPQLKPDLSRADELIPYRKLDACRIKLSGEANWDPSPYLSDEFLLPFQEPDVLLTQASFDYDNVPDLSREDPDELLSLALLWDSKNLLSLRTDLVPFEMMPSCLRCFNCFKDSSQDRLIGDRRGRNQLESSTPGPSRYLPSGPSLAILEVPPSSTVVICATDLKDYYHQLKVSERKARANAMWPPVPLSFLQSTRAYDVLLETYKSRKHWTREQKGDDLAALVGSGPTKDTRTKKLSPSMLVHACFNTVAQGDHLGVEIATDSHRGLLKSRRLLIEKEELVNCRPFAGDKVLQGLVIDDYFALSIEKDDVVLGESEARARFDLATATYKEEGLKGSPHKDIVEEQKAKIAGAELDSSPDTRKLRVVTLGCPVVKRLALALVSQELVRLRSTTDALHACLVGGWTSALMFRRPLMSVLFASHRLVNSSCLDSACPKVIPLPRDVAQELLLLAILSPLMVSDLSVPLGNRVFCTDSSDTKGAVVSTPVNQALSGSKKGGYAKLLTKQEALLHRLSSRFGGALLQDDEEICEKEKPRKSPLLRFDFLEICGGASKVSRELSLLGWTVGPSLDLDSSPFFDLSSLDLFRWVCHLLESGRLDGFLVQPPCTTFSPAQHPSLRSYRQPRGFNPTEARTLLGTCLAFRSLGLMLVASRAGAIGLLEQSRRSKMAWLDEWRAFLENGWGS